MKKWKISKTQLDKIGLLLNDYAESLSECTSNILNGYFLSEIYNNKFYYIFRIKNIDKTISDIELFKITVIDTDGRLLLTVNYYNDVHNINTDIDNLESKLDSIIQSEKMGNYIYYLIEWTKKIK